MCMENYLQHSAKQQYKSLVGKNNIEIIGPSSLQSTIYVRSNYQMIILENFENCGAFSEIKF